MKNAVSPRWLVVAVSLASSALVGCVSDSPNDAHPWNEYWHLTWVIESERHEERIVQGSLGEWSTDGACSMSTEQTHSLVILDADSGASLAEWEWTPGEGGNKAHIQFPELGPEGLMTYRCEIWANLYFPEAADRYRLVFDGEGVVVITHSELAGDNLVEDGRSLYWVDPLLF